MVSMAYAFNNNTFECVCVTQISVHKIKAEHIRLSNHRMQQSMGKFSNKAQHHSSLHMESAFPQDYRKRNVDFLMQNYNQNQVTATKYQ